MAEAAEVREYEYEPQPLRESEVLDAYAQAKAQHPNAIITLGDFDCGHWEIKVYETPEEKQRLVIDRVRKALEAIFATLRR